MTDTILTVIHGAVLILFGVFLSTAFSGIRLNSINFISCIVLCAICGGLQALFLFLYGENFVRKLYPVITHIPCFLFLTLFFRRRASTALISMMTAYLCCQPAKWFGILAYSLFPNAVLIVYVRIFFLILSAWVILAFFAPYLAAIFTKNRRSLYIFGTVPVFYYLFDYASAVYTDFWTNNNSLAAEFLAFFLCIAFFIFSFVYYRENERKTKAERKEEMIRIKIEQQAKEIEAVRRIEQETRMFRHDMRMLLSTLAASIHDDNHEKALEIISSYSSLIEKNNTRSVRYCQSDIFNYILSDFAAKCDSLSIKFLPTVELGDIAVDEIMYSTILSNTLDNVINAQTEVAEEKRYVKLLLKTSEGKLLLEVKNTFGSLPVFSDGLPVSSSENHGYGTMSIRYMTEHLGGNCQFSVHDNLFITRVIV